MNKENGETSETKEEEKKKVDFTVPDVCRKCDKHPCQCKPGESE